MKKVSLIAAAVGSIFAAGSVQADASPVNAVLTNYADIALMGYSDSLSTAKALDAALHALIDAPSADTLAAAKTAWLAARVPYQQTEAYRFGNAVVDEWEGKVNAWPLDEGLIDYVDTAYYGSESDDNALYTANVIANPKLMINGEEVDATEITPELLGEQLHEAGEIEANVSTGYHAIEFLLWGQDLNGTNAGSGDRPYTDFDTENCTNGNCDRRAQYLSAASELLISDLQEMVDAWGKDGEARKAVLSDEQAGLATILTGMGSLSYGELAGERMKLGLLVHDPEEEHDCFSDNTHNSHYYDVQGIQNVFLGEYTMVNGEKHTGASLYDYLKAQSGDAPKIADELKSELGETMVAMQAMVDRAESVEAYDQMIGAENAEGNATVQTAIDGLITQTKSIERAIKVLNLGTIELEGSDSLDNVEAVFQ